MEFTKIKDWQNRNENSQMGDSQVKENLGKIKKNLDKHLGVLCGLK